jgi:hypothetical protein
MPRLALVALILYTSTARADLGINLYGGSYHFDRDKAREIGLTNERNPGVGLRWRKPHSETLDLFVDAGFYDDSARNTAKLVGGGALWHATERLRLGGGAVLLQSNTYNRGDPFIAPAPIAAYEWRRVTLNLVYFPKWRDVNPTNQVGAWLTIWFP